MSIEFQISEDLALNGGVCPKCGKFFKPNGVGPANNKILTTFFDNLPSSHLLRYGANFHDWYYKLGRNIYDPSHPAYSNRELCRKLADDIFYKKNQEIISKKCKWYDTWFYQLMNKRNYLVVREFGEKHFSFYGCGHTKT
jgi:hypothetical protein